MAGAVIGRAAGGIMDTVANVFGGLIGDAIREWRTRNLIRHLARTAEILEARGVSLDKAKALPMGEAYAMFEEASKQDDPTLAEMWSALLANAMDATKGVRIEPAFVATLRVISGVDAHVLRFFREFRQEQLASQNSKPKLHYFRIPRSKADEDEMKSIDDQRRAIDQAFVVRSEEIRQFHLGSFDERIIQQALANLVKERCICVPAPSFSARSLSSGREYGNVELVSEAKLQDALEEISSSIDEHSGRPDMLPGLLDANASPVDANYDLTDHGMRLLLACEAQSVSE